MTRRMDPFDAAVAVCGVAMACAALLLAGIVRGEVVHGIVALWPVFLALSGVAWLTTETWAPLSASVGQQVITLAAFVGVEAFAVAPLVAVAWELVGPRAILGAAVASAAIFAALAVFALAKPASYLETLDPLVVLAITMITVLLVSMGVGLPFRLVWAAPVIAVTGLLVLDQTARAAAFLRPGQHVAGGTRLFACVSMLFGELLYDFVAMARGESTLWCMWLESAE